MSRSGSGTEITHSSVQTNQTMSARPFSRLGISLLLFVAVLFTGCGEAPLGAVGRRSSDWINAPEVVTTTAPPVFVPIAVDIDKLLWSNDEIVSESLTDPASVVAQVFDRREGDRFIQASRAEIAAALPDVRFPANAPYGAQWVSSQLVVENNGLLSTDPSAAFGIWSAEPYTRSRSVAQMVVLTISSDRDTVAEVAESDPDASCARFADDTTELCDIVEIGDRPVWRLIGRPGTTMIWFDGAYIYELFARTFVSLDALNAMVGESVPLSEVSPPAS